MTATEATLSVLKQMKQQLRDSDKPRGQKKRQRAYLALLTDFLIREKMNLEEFLNKNKELLSEEEASFFTHK